MVTSVKTILSRTLGGEWEYDKGSDSWYMRDGEKSVTKRPSEKGDPHYYLHVAGQKEANEMVFVKDGQQYIPIFDRADGRGVELQEGRRESILGNLVTQCHFTFHCHKTVYREDGRNEDEEGAFIPNDVTHCAGAVAVRLRVIGADHYDEAYHETVDEHDLNSTLLAHYMDPRRVEEVEED